MQLHNRRETAPRTRLSGEKLTQAIANAGTNQRQLALRLGLHPQQVSKMIADGTTNVTVDTLGALAAALGVEVGELLVEVR